MREVTFILPTYNRKEFVCRAVDSCLAVAGAGFQSRVLVIDGESTDGAWELLQRQYGDSPRVTLTQNQAGTGFQRTAFAGALEVQTEYVTFMYNDDVLSPYYHLLLRRMIDGRHSFIMGYGGTHPIDGVYPFVEPSIASVDKQRLLAAYFGDLKALDYYGMPVSPICLIMRTEHLQEWVEGIWNWVGDSSFRRWFMIEKNVGPDIILYLWGILRQETTVELARNVVGQFSEHPDSMSVQYGVDPLTTGYWIGRIWAFEQMIADRGISAALTARAGGYLVVSGLRVLVKMVRAGEWKWVGASAGEIAKVAGLIVRRGLGIRSMYFAVITVLDRRGRRQARAVPT